MEKRFYTVYQITNLVNQKTYIGCHQTNDLNDNYYGSGKLIRQAIKKHSLKNFKKEFLFIFNNKQEMLDKEAELVNEEFLQRKDVYNILPGGGSNTSGFVSVKDKENNTFLVRVDDPRYLNGELTHVSKGKIVCKDKNGNYKAVYVNSDEYQSGKFTNNFKGKTAVKDNDGNTFLVNKNELSKFDHVTKNTVSVKDKDGNTFKVDINDKRFQNGELVGVTKGNKLSSEHKKKIGLANSKHQKGKNNSQHGTCWIYNFDLKQNKKIKKNTINHYLKQGWLKGRKTF